jgi:alcohol dehydrogenase (cytochrome c)
VTNQELLNPPSTTWPLYHGDYSGERHTRLAQITPENVGYLSLAWVFQTNQTAQIKSSPLLVDGILYFTVPDNIWAVDARSGHMLWHYNRPSTQGDHIGQRGVAMYGDWLYFTTPDAHLISLNAKDGSVRWDKLIADVNRGYWTTMAPLVVKDHVIVGVSGDFDNLPGYLRAFDPTTGATQWQWDSTPPAGTPNSTTGGMTWMTGTYDPELNLVYWGTGNPTPVLNGKPRPEDNPIRSAICSLDLTVIFAAGKIAVIQGIILRSGNNHWAKCSRGNLPNLKTCSQCLSMKPNIVRFRTAIQKCGHFMLQTF